MGTIHGHREFQRKPFRGPSWHLLWARKRATVMLAFVMGQGPVRMHWSRASPSREKGLAKLSRRSSLRSFLERGEVGMSLVSGSRKRRV